MAKGPEDGVKCSETKDAGKIGNGRNDKLNEGLGQIDNVIGNFGKYQFLIFMFKILIGATSAFNNLGVTFFAPADFISYWCADAPSPGATTTSTAFPATLESNYTTNFGGLDPLSLLVENQRASNGYLLHNHTLARRSSGSNNDYNNNGLLHVFGDFLNSDERRHRHSLGLNYDTPKNLRKECSFVSPVDNRAHKCTAFQYDTGIWISTIIDEWDLVCDRAWFVSVAQSLYMAGFIISYLAFGYISDRFGRWRSLLMGGSIEILSGFGCAFAGSARSFMLFRFLLGLGNAGRSSSSYLIMIEWTGPKWRVHISTLGSLGWILGYCLMPWITIYFLHFRHMQLFVCFYELIFVIWLLRLPESPRWLLTHRRFDEAYKVLLMAARFNGLIREEKVNGSNGSIGDIENNGYDNTPSWLKNVGGHMSTSFLYANARAQFGGTKSKAASLNGNACDVESTGCGLTAAESSSDLRPYTLQEYDMKFKRLTETICAKEFTKNEDRLNITDLFKWKNLRKYTLILAFAWASNSFIYYGIALRVGDFGGKNLFIAFTIAGITELPAIAFTILCMKFLPRKTTNLFLFATVGLLCAIQAPLKYYNYQWLQQSSMMLAKLFNSCSFTCILYQTMELFPTSIRQTAYSSCSLAGRIGSILAPFIKELSQMTNSFVPPVIYAALSLASALSIKHLPETKGSDLPDTLLEAEKFKGTDKIRACSQDDPPMR